MLRTSDGVTADWLGMARTPKPYPSDLDDAAWAFVAPYVTLMREDAPQRKHDLRRVMNALLWIVRAGAPWSMLPHAVYSIMLMHHDLGRLTLGFGHR